MTMTKFAKGTFDTLTNHGTQPTKGLISPSRLWGIHKPYKNTYHITHLPTGYYTAKISELGKAKFFVSQIEQEPWPASWDTKETETFSQNMTRFKDMLYDLDDAYKAWKKQRNLDRQQAAEKKKKFFSWEWKGKHYQAELFYRKSYWIMHENPDYEKEPLGARFVIALPNAISFCTCKSKKLGKAIIADLLATSFPVPMEQVAKEQDPAKAKALAAPNQELFRAILDKHASELQ